GSTLVSTTGADGRYALDRVPAGRPTVHVRLTGFRTVAREVRVAAGDTTRLDVTLQTDAQILAAVRTDARAADAELFLTKPNISTLTMSAAAMSGVPIVGEPDVVRFVQLLPGVAARNDFNTGLNVRGGEADQNLILLDGFPIYNPFHLGGLFSTFMDATVGGIDLMTGAFPARFGGRLSSVLDVKSAIETRPGAHLTADISALGATGRLAGTFGEGKGTWSIAGRRTYADALTSAFTNNIFPYHFQDFHGTASYMLPGDVRVSVTGYAGKDVLQANLAEFESDSATLSKTSRGNWAFDWGNRVLGVTIAKDVSERVRIEQRFSTSNFSTTLDLGQGAFAQRSKIGDVRAAGSLFATGASNDFSVGYDVAAQRIGYSSGSSQTGTNDFDLEQKPVSGSVWADDMLHLSSRWLVEGGLRAEALSGRQWAALSPRVSLKYIATPQVAYTAGAGRVTQTLHSLSGDGPLRYFDIWLSSDEFLPVASAWHYVAGAERRIRDVGSVKVEGYFKKYDRVLETNPSEDPHVRGDEFFSATGFAYGVDMLARWQPGTGASGWVSYSYGMSTRKRDGLEWSPGNDRRHDLNVVATWPMASYRVGARFGFATGTPYTPIVGAVTRRVYDPSLDRWGTGDPEILIESLGGVKNSARFPATHRLDLDVSREFQVRGATLSPYLSVVNAYNAKNVFVYIYKYSSDVATRRAISQFPILPSAGVRIAF
ncbi:MAG: TonB-dependent receptor, partial [bacterium]